MFLIYIPRFQKIIYYHFKPCYLLNYFFLQPDIIMILLLKIRLNYFGPSAAILILKTSARFYLVPKVNFKIVVQVFFKVIK